MAEWFALILLKSISCILKDGRLKWTPYDSRNDVKFDVKVIKNSKFAYFPLFQISKVQIFSQGWTGKWVCGLLDTFRIYSISVCSK